MPPSSPTSCQVTRPCSCGPTKWTRRGGSCNPCSTSQTCPSHTQPGPGAPSGPTVCSVTKAATGCCPRSELEAAPIQLDDCRSEEHTSELQSRENLVCRLLLEKKKHK